MQTSYEIVPSSEHVARKRRNNVEQQDDQVVSSKDDYSMKPCAATYTAKVPSNLILPAHAKRTRDTSHDHALKRVFRYLICVFSPYNNKTLPCI